MEVVQEFLGHENISTTRDVYATTVGIQVVREWLDRADDGSLEEAVRRHAREVREWEGASQGAALQRAEELLPEMDSE